MFKIVDKQTGTVVRATRDFGTTTRYNPRHYSVEL